MPQTFTNHCARDRNLEASKPRISFDGLHPSNQQEDKIAPFLYSYSLPPLSSILTSSSSEGISSIPNLPSFYLYRFHSTSSPSRNIEFHSYLTKHVISKTSNAPLIPPINLHIPLNLHTLSLTFIRSSYTTITQTIIYTIRSWTFKHPRHQHRISA